MWEEGIEPSRQYIRLTSALNTFVVLTHRGQTGLT